ncbi:hypothetical protein IPC443_31505 [Pseudomonas aeruginosa]|nr:hypothetical protein IPC443_31505 [Pseudomonas aeruginosa]
MTRRCACCGKPFQPRPQVPAQAFCSTPDCQRARKRQWQRARLQSDPDYRINQRAAQQAWSQRNPGYWRNHRAPSVKERRFDSDLAKMDVCDLPSGLYRIKRHPDFPGENSNSCVVEITLVALMPPLKMDVSREDLIDPSVVCP